MQRQFHLFAQLIGRAVHVECQPSLAELLAAGQISHLLHPISVENRFACEEAPAPGIVDAGKHRAARTEMAEHQDRRLALSFRIGVARMLSKDLAHAGFWLNPAAIPENRLY